MATEEKKTFTKEDTENRREMEIGHFHSNRLYSAHIIHILCMGCVLCSIFGKFAIDVIHKVFVTFVFTQTPKDPIYRHIMYMNVVHRDPDFMA